jgi:cobalt-zinc-cadmium efflux system outer membrane protein
MFFSPISGLHLRACLIAGLLIFNGLQSHALAQNNEPSLSLKQAITKTLTQNPQLHQFTVKREGIVGNRQSADLRPALTLGLQVENVAGSGELADLQSAETTIALSSVIELGGKRASRLAVSDAQIQTVDYKRQAFTLDVLGELTAAFILGLEIQEHIALAREGRELAAKTLTIVKRRSQQGAATESEALRAAAALSRAQLQWEAMELRRQQVAIKLAAFWGETSPQWLQLEGDLYNFGRSSAYASLYERAQESPAIAIYANETRLKNAELALAKTQSTVDLSWQLGIRRFEASGDTAFTAGVSVPLFSGSRNRGAVTSARAAQNEVVYERQTALLKLHVQLFEAHSQRQQHVEAVKVFRETIIPDLNAALIATQQAYERGRYSYQETITAQNELLDAKRSLIEHAAAASLNQAIIEQLIAEPLTKI